MPSKKQTTPIINPLDKKILIEAAGILRLISQHHNNEFQKTRDSENSLEQHKGRLAMEKAVQLSRMANEVELVATTDGL